MTSVHKYKAAPRTADTKHNVRDAALHGASLAFSKPPPPPKPIANTYTGAGNGALLAATKVGSPQHGVPAGSPASLTADNTGGSIRNRRYASRSNSSQSLNQSLAVPGDHQDRVSSPSNIAARLAAARYSPLRPTTPATAPMVSERHANESDILPPSGSVGSVLARLEPRQPTAKAKRRDSLESQDHKPTDETPIPPTTSLVKMFERGRAATPTTKPNPRPLSVAQRSPPPVRSPKPQRTFKLPPEPQDDAPLVRQRTQTPPPIKPKPKHKIELPPAQSFDGAAYFHTSQKDPMKSPPIKQKPVQLAALKTSTSSSPIPPPQRGSRKARPMSEDIRRTTVAARRASTSVHSEKEPDSPASFKSAKEMQESLEKPKPELPPPRRSATRKVEAVQSTTTRPRSAAPVPIPRRQDQLPTSMRSSSRFSPPRRPTSTGTSPSVYHNPYQRDSVRQITKHMTGESLSSAIMGAALAASSRNASPARSRPMSIEPLFPPRNKHHHHPFHRSPSPPKQSPPKTIAKLRTTLRKEPSSSEDEDEVEKYKKKGSRIMGIKQRKHPNKHHEGTRKRWRDQITERERKRYEGVWAANKGLHLPPPSPTYIDNDPAQDVLNLVTQEIWLRSRLPVHVLEEVWDLVDSRAVGRLKRDEFVVGLWLIDQRLKGRKLPVKVGESVWTSARGVGVKVKVRG